MLLQCLVRIFSMFLILLLENTNQAYNIFTVPTTDEIEIHLSEEENSFRVNSHGDSQ